MSNPAWHMRRALRLAEQGKGWTLPNPMVGAILIKDGERIGEGYHSQYGAAHAEVEALQNVATMHPNASTEGATLYVTLEPCCHQGKTPPCTKAIIAAGISKVVIAVKDPSEKIDGKGIEELRAAGIKVEVGLLEKDARELNRFFFTFHEKKRPHITLKAALSLDGKITTLKKNGSLFEKTRTALTGLPAQRYSHALRHEHQAILVGSGTVITDNPHLGTRHIKGRDPLRIILTGERPIPKKSLIFRDKNILILNDKTVSEMLGELYQKNITSILVEGGHNIFASFLAAGIVDELQLFIAPIFLGENSLPFAELETPLILEQTHIRTLGKDLLIQAVPKFNIQ